MNNDDGIEFFQKNKRFIYVFLLVHMLGFALPSFYMAYFDAEKPTIFLFLWGGIAIYVYLKLYLSFFGLDEIKWLIINSILGLFGIFVEVSWALSFFSKDINDYPNYIHAIPFIFYVLYTFLLRRAVLDFSCAYTNITNKMVNNFYVIFSILIYLLLYVVLYI